MVPFDSNATFRRYISEPLLTDPKAGGGNLRLLLKSICLRRTRLLLDLPNDENETPTLFLSTEEKSVYSQIIKDTTRKIDDCISNASIAKAYNGIFQVIMRLRLLCNNGTHQICDSSPELQGACAEDEHVQEDKVTCQFCSYEITLSDGQNNISYGASPQNSLHVLCPACLSRNEVDENVCQKVLQEQWPTSSRHIQQIQGTENNNSKSHSESRARSTSLRQSLLLNRHSTKLSALVNNIQAHMPGNKRYGYLLQRRNRISINRFNSALSSRYGKRPWIL